ncbi:twin-arginine translocase TatA/TatE family subunit [Fundidesulfovibrio soli]|uniref:twin-arginine translocase TatA/TatE family subunit n=1 Tax=Fundidesulfovibrio soli TaxID=2922716 RepID=UPI001FAFB7EE|nr:twin-arginine translocase TatA/TatE family subunit [Fundidesulfovibrio soli]
MFSSEMILILIVALVLIGPSKLPEIMKMAAKGLSEIRRLSLEVKSTLQQEVEKIDAAKRIEEAKKEYFGDIENVVNDVSAQVEKTQAELEQAQAPQEQPEVPQETAASEPVQGEQAAASEPAPEDKTPLAEAPKADEAQSQTEAPKAAVAEAQAESKESKEKSHA